MKADTFPYSFNVNAVTVVDKDEPVVVSPGEAELKAIARCYELDGIDALTADFMLKPYRKAGLRVVGSVNATLRQTCVVSLEPFESTLKIDVDRTFEPRSVKARKIRDLNDDGEIEIDLESLDPPDVILDGVLDLGEVICEELALALDPFPRKPGIEFADAAEVGNASVADTGDDGDEKPSPFAALQALKEKPAGGN